MYEFKMPALGAEMTHGKLLEWKIKIGDKVKRHDIVAIIDTDKAAIEVESFGEGIVDQLLVQPEEVVAVGTVMAIFSGEDQTVSQPTAVTANQRIKISPRARKKAAELGIDIDQVKGQITGVITIDDIKQHAVRQKTAHSDTVSMQHAIGQAMAKSKKEIPHYYLVLDMDMSNALNWLDEYNRQHSIDERMVYVAILIKATASALKKFKEFNGYYINNEFIPHSEINIGMAISLRGGGLIAPALLNCEQKKLSQIMYELSDLVMRARTGKLRDKELSSATITITNLGELGADSVFGVIYPPQVSLLGFGKIKEHTITATLAADHRVSNGLSGSRFLAAIHQLLQDVEKL